jgi:CRP/FNR family cyclic AMP-dependent transcriptional regulator
MARQLSRLRSDERTLIDGEWVFRMGDSGAAMFIIVSGRIEIVRGEGEDERVVSVLDRGEFFGEMSLLESLPRSAHARASGTTRLLVITQGNLLTRLRVDPSLATEMLHKMSGRLRQVSTQLEEGDFDLDFEVDLP